LTSKCCSKKKTKKAGDNTEEASDDEFDLSEMPNKSLGLFSKENKMRKMAITLDKNPKFDNFILILIAVSSVILALENPLNDPSGTLAKFLKIQDPIVTIIFIFEVFVRVISEGLICNGKKSYLRDVWHALDFTIVFFSVITLFPFFGAFSFFKIIRMARLFRPLRIISRNENLRLSI